MIRSSSSNRAAFFTPGLSLGFSLYILRNDMEEINMRNPSNILENPYEDILAELLLKGLMHRYGSIEETEVFPLLYLRYELLEHSKPSMEDYLLNELNLSKEDQYRGISIGQGRVIKNLTDNLSFRYSLTMDDKKLEVIKKIVHKTARFRARKFRKVPEYEVFYQYFLVDELSKEFDTVFQSPLRFKEFQYAQEEKPYERCLEERLNAHIHAVKLHSTHAVFVTEEQVENYLSRNLSLIEEELTLVDRQVRVDGGRIDILARDKEGTLVILEIKVEEDKDILWQCTHYPIKIKELFKENCVRMMTVCPQYRPQIRTHLEGLSGVEIFEYDAVTEIGKLLHLEVRKLSKKL